MSTPMKRETNSPRDHPRYFHSDFYAIVPSSGDMVDIYLIPNGTIYPIQDGFKEYDVDIRIVRGIAYYDGLEEDIRARYSVWCDIAEKI